jgi:16S rRNA (adenine1518-N6/adenine1519-N6)-dimethyltransferase
MFLLPDTNKALGQHWLTDIAALQAMVDAAGITFDDTVLEIGPGAGTLTELLIAQSKQVVAVEFDKALAADLPKVVKAGNLKVINQDILRFDFSTLPPDYKLAANIPYYLTSNLIRVISETPNRAKQVALLVQKEVAQRVAAQPGSMSLLSVSAQYYWDVSTDLIVPARLFTPPPKVDSQILVLKRRDEPLFAGVDSIRFFQVVKAGFAARRKTILNSLSGGLRLDKPHVTGLLAEAGLNPGQRPQELSLDQWYDLYKAIIKSEL